MTFDEKTLNTESMQLILNLNRIIYKINDILEKLYYLQDKKQQITVIYDAKIEQKILLEDRIQEIIAQNYIYGDEKQVLEETLRQCTDRKRKSILKKRIKNIAEILDDLKDMDIRAKTELKRIYETISEESRLNHQKFLTSKQRQLTFFLCEQLSKYRKICRELKNTHQIYLREINLSDCVNSLASGEIVPIAKNFKSYNIFASNYAVYSDPVTINGVTYTVELI